MADVGITLEIAAQRLQDYLAAEKKILASQEYRIADRLQRRALLSEVQDDITLWQERIDKLGGTTRRAVGRIRRGSYRIR
jgi:mRNA-degrading endonuclease RelE of RelBE toxin-antitoxin system